MHSIHESFDLEQFGDTSIHGLVNIVESSYVSKPD